MPVRIVILVLLLAGQAAGETGEAADEYHWISHCDPRYGADVFAKLRGADLAIRAHVVKDPQEKPVWYRSTVMIDEVFFVNEPVLGEVKAGEKLRIFADSRRRFSREALHEQAKRADDHDDPAFLWAYLPRFLKSGAIGKRASDECFHVPAVIEHVDYVIVLKGKQVVYIEPILSRKDYFLKLIRGFYNGS